MRLIYQNGQRVGPNPAGYYVYLWRRGADDIYVGRGGGSAGRWSDHLAASPNDDNQRKARYFAQHKGEMDAFIIVEGLASEAEAAAREDAEKVARDSGGTLLNKRAAAAFYGRAPNGQRTSPNPFDNRLWRRLKKEGRFAPNALVWALVADCDRKDGVGGRRHFETVYPPIGERITVAEVLKRGADEGFTPGQQRDHMACDFCRGLIGIALPDGETLTPGDVVPTKALVAKLALEIGTEAEWLRHVALREGKGGKIGG
jgi:hypothetical protein